jgi:tetratricopeptide (TPR) repeat protein
MFAEARDLISRKNYKEADAVARKIFIYNLAVDHKYDNGLKRLQYDINFGWANQLFDSGKFDAASDKVEYALRYNKTEEALSLQSKIQESKEKTDIATSFPVWLENIDDLIARQEYAMAVKKINYCELKIKDDPRKAQLEARKKRMLDQVETIYKAAVDNFVNENYEDAIDQFENVLAISPGYKDASNYLQEARSKEKILKSY